MRNYFKLLRFLKGHIPILIGASACMLVSAVFEGVQLSLIVPMTDKILGKGKITMPHQVPDFVSRIIDKINATPAMTLLGIMAIGVLVLFLLKGLFSFLHGYLMNDVSQRVMRDMRLRLYRTIQNLSLDYFSKKRTGELVSRITNDVQVVENAVSYGIADHIYQSFRILIFISIILFIYPKIFIVTITLFL